LIGADRSVLRYPGWSRLTDQSIIVIFPSLRGGFTEKWSISTLTDEQKNLREMAHDFAVKEIRPVAWEYDKDGTWPQDIIEKAWEVGLMNSHIEEQYGGAGAGYLDGCLIEEELSWGCSGIQTSLGCNGLATGADRARRSEEIKEEVPLARSPKRPSSRPSA